MKFEMDLVRIRAWRNEDDGQRTEVHLSYSEFAIAAELYKRRPHVLPVKFLAELTKTSRTFSTPPRYTEKEASLIVRVFVRRIRKKFGTNDVIENRKSWGYCWGEE